MNYIRIISPSTVWIELLISTCITICIEMTVTAVKHRPCLNKRVVALQLSEVGHFLLNGKRFPKYEANENYSKHLFC